MSKGNFNYIGISQIKEEHEASDRLRFVIRDKESGLELAYIITNGRFCGSWRENHVTGALDQVAGTSQFSLPRSAEGVRKLLRRKALDWVAIRAEVDGGDWLRIYQNLVAVKR